MSKEEELLECWRELLPESQEQVLQLAQSLKSQPHRTNATTLLEAAGDLIGSIPDLPPDLSTNQSYFQGFGQS